jgi:hypothetical protein
MLFMCLTGAALTPTALEIALNNIDIYSLSAGESVYWLRWPKNTLTGWLTQWSSNCLSVDISRAKEGPRFGWTSSANFIYQTWTYHLLKGNIKAATPESEAFCESGYSNFLTPVVDTSPIPPIPPVVATSITPIPAGQILNAPSGVWTFGTAKGGGDYWILLNGQPATNGAGTKLVLSNGSIYHVNVVSAWYIWTGTNWASSTPQVVP